MERTQLRSLGCRTGVHIANHVVTNPECGGAQSPDALAHTFSVLERYVAAVGASGRYLLLEGDHFVLLKQADQVQAAIADWILQQEDRHLP